MQENLSFGEIVSWTPPSEIDLQALREALQAAGVDQKFIRDMLPRNAFARAARALAENRVIHQTGEESGFLYFQLTRQSLSEVDKSMDFWKEAVLRLNKTTGEIDCHDAPNLSDFEQSQLVDLVRRKVDAELSRRKGTDITLLVQRIFKMSAADLVAVREAGGAYFVPQAQTHVTDTVQSILEKIAGKILRFGIGGGSAETSRSIAESMSAHLQGLVEEFRQSCEIVDTSSSAAVIKRRTERHRALQAKLEIFRELLQGHSQTVEESLRSAHAEFESRRLGHSIPMFEEAAPVAEPAPAVELSL